MEERILFVSGEKSFELINISTDSDRWFSLIERNRRFTSRIKIDETNLRWVCENLYNASKGKGNLYRKWGRKINSYIFRVYQNFNYYGRFVRVETRLGDRKNAIIIPEAVQDQGWNDIATKILRFLGNYNNPRFNLASHSRSYAESARIPTWPSTSSSKPGEQAPISASAETSQILARCLVGSFNDPFDHNPNPEDIQKWFISRWKICSALKVTPMNHNQFLFELPSRQEAIRVHAGEWFWKGRRLSLQWWSPVAGSDLAAKIEKHSWVKAFGIPAHAWSLDTFTAIGDLCGGFVGIDEDTKNRSQLVWTRICIRKSLNKDLPTSTHLDVDGWRYVVFILPDNHIKMKPIAREVGKAIGNTISKAEEFNVGQNTELSRGPAVKGAKATLDVAVNHVDTAAKNNFNSNVSSFEPGPHVAVNHVDNFI